MVFKERSIDMKNKLFKAALAFGVIAMSSSVMASNDYYDQKIAELESRIEALENILLGSEAPIIEETQSEAITLSSGLYIVGENIDAGHYSVKAVGGSEGYVSVWSDYDEYKENSWSIFYADFSAELRNPGYSVSFPEIQNALDNIPTEISNIILENGNCLSIQDVVVELYKK